MGLGGERRAGYFEQIWARESAQPLKTRLTSRTPKLPCGLISRRCAGCPPPPALANSRTPSPGKVARGMLKEVPRFVSKGQHSKGGAFVSELFRQWTRETLGAGRVPWVPDRLPYGPRRLFAAGRRLRTPRGVAPWRAARGRVAAARRRVPAGSSTIPARRESPSRLGRPAPAARRPLPQGAGGGAPAPSPKQSLLVRPRSARGRQARALGLRGDCSGSGGPARHALRSTL